MKGSGCGEHMTGTTHRTDRWLTLTARLCVVWLIGAAMGCSAHATNRTSTMPAPLVIQAQGSFAVGGTVVTAPGTFDPIAQGAFNPAGPDPRGQTLHGDHAYVFYQVPANARRLPLVFWHGHGQSAKTWETTPDGREGFQTIFLRRRFAVYLNDQPRRGRVAHRDQESNHPGHRVLPARRGLPLPRGGGALAGVRRSHVHASHHLLVVLHAAHEGPHHRLLR